jgi:fused signal recognition particle receptor
VPVIKHREGADPGAVVFDAVAAARARGVEVLIVDTAGRLHTKSNLMDELKKIQRILARELPGAPHETLLVLDATTGQNALAQAKTFHQAVGVTGIVLTKLDGTPKGGMVFAITRELSLPVKFVGVGEGIDDLRSFDPREFVDALL